MKNLKFDTGVYFCGIDPGFSGAIAILDFNSDIVHYMDMPVYTILKKRVLNEPAICMIFRKYKPMIVGIEKAQTMPGQGLVSSGRYMDSYGFLRGMCVGMKYQYHLIRPTSWKKKMLFDMPKDKHSSIVKVGQLYPEIELLRKKDHGIADAILIARYMISTISPITLQHLSPYDHEEPPPSVAKSIEDQVIGI
ncbi:MAG: crossover junction endodeoxyribonuclease [Flammeovirgaceae bacterium]|nr:crossover junction endodeoxyribonuclease [Flammeovirgaceae bacterium]